MEYETTGKKVNKDTAKNVRNYSLKSVGTGAIIWHLVKRHKFGLMTLYALVMTLQYIFPAIIKL